MPEERERVYGPIVEAERLPGWSAAVLQTYAGTVKAPVLWRGKVAILYMSEPLFDIECSLLESNRGGDPYAAWPQRAYEDRNGQTKYASLVWCHNRVINGMVGQAIRLELGDSSAEDDMPTPPDTLEGLD